MAIWIKPTDTIVFQVALKLASIDLSLKKLDGNVSIFRSKKTLVPEPLEERVLTPDEKNFLLSVERGDTAGAQAIISALGKRPQIFDVNCVDPLGRSALIIAVENENLDMMVMLVQNGIKLKVRSYRSVSVFRERPDGLVFCL